MSRVALPVISPDGRKILARAAKVFSPENRIVQAASECSELSAALNRFLSYGRPRRDTYKQVVEEGADTLLMLAQLGHVFPGFYRDLSREASRKLCKMEGAVAARERELAEAAMNEAAEAAGREAVGPRVRPWWRAFWRTVL